MGAIGAMLLGIWVICILKETAQLTLMQLYALYLGKNGVLPFVFESEETKLLNQGRPNIYETITNSQFNSSIK